MIPSEVHIFTQHSSMADISLGVGEHKDDRSFFKEEDRDANAAQAVKCNNIKTGKGAPGSGGGRGAGKFLKESNGETNMYKMI